MKALIAMSGGVDSSVAAKLMLAEGADCIGCTMLLYEAPELAAVRGVACCSKDDTDDARSVAFRLGIPHYVLNFKAPFREKVIARFAESYACGRTPNPCIDCNRYIKFGLLLERAEVLGCDCIVTGHYARIKHDGGRYVLKKAVDETKDQSYFLYDLSQEQLARIRFPLGALRKTEVREIARENGFANAKKHDSQDICFAPDGDCAGAVERYLGAPCPSGEFLDTNGRVLGTHRGLHHYTIGQRRGLGVSAAQPLYVCRLDAERNAVILGTKEQLLTSELMIDHVRWISGETPTGMFRCKVKTRYRGQEQWAAIEPLGDDQARIMFDMPQRAAAAGQAAVLYDGDIVLGGGTIREANAL